MKKVLLLTLAFISSALLNGCETKENSFESLPEARLNEEQPVIEKTNLEDVVKPETVQPELAEAEEDSSIMMMDMEQSTGHYEAYSSEAFAELKGSEPFLLFFHASWCPACQALEKNIKNDLSVLNNHTLLKADYDSETELKKEYTITTQTTVLFFNADGSLEKKTVNPSLSEIETFFN